MNQMDKEERSDKAEKEHKAKEEKLEEKPPAVEKKAEKLAKEKEQKEAKKEKDASALAKEKRKTDKEASASSAKKSRLSGMKRLLRSGKVGEAKKSEREEKKPETAEEPFTILKFVLMTEKAIQLIEKENKLVFIVDRKCSKDDVKRAAESAFQASVYDVETMIDQKSRKKAFIRFKEPGVAGDIAMRLGII